MKELLTNLLQPESKDSEIITPNFKKSTAHLGSVYGGDYNDYNDYGNSFDESGYDLPGIVVTPGGNYPEDDSWNNGRDPWNDNNQDDEWGFDDFIGGNSYGLTTDKDYSNGIAVINAMNDSIKNGSALVVEKFSDSNTYKVCNLSSYAGNFVIPSMDLYAYYSKEVDQVVKLGRTFSRGNAIVGGIFAVITAFDDEPDWWAIAGAVAGITGAFLCPPASLLPLVFDGIAIFCGAMSLAQSSSGGGSSQQQY